MQPGTIFVSHRAEYASLVRRLQKTIETTSGGQINVVISEDLPGGEAWRPAIKAHLDEAESLFLVYGAPYEDWSWCFYEVGYFAGLGGGEKKDRRIYCIARPDVDAPGPLSDLQLVTDHKSLNAALMEIYKRNNVDYDPGELRQSTSEAAKGLFGKLEEFVTYPRVYFTATDSDFGAHADLPSSAAIRGDPTVLTQLFGIGKKSVPWAEILQAASDRPPQEFVFFSKWAEETKKIILAARNNRFMAPQTVLVRGGQRARFLLYVARRQGDGLYCCEFLVINDVGGPALGLSPALLALLTSVRLGLRFRFEFIKPFRRDPAGLTDEERRNYIREIPRIIDSIMIESEARGNITLDDLRNAFDEDEAGADRIEQLVGYWPVLKDNLYQALGVSADGMPVSDQGLKGPNAVKYRRVLEALDLINADFLARCSARLSRRMSKKPEELNANAEAIERIVGCLSGSEERTAA
jgi:hypothetical protein